MTTELFPNAPIREAVIDIQIENDVEGFNVEDIAALMQNSLPEGYSEIEAIHQQKFGVNIGEQGTVHTDERVLLGYRCKNDAENYIVQLRSNGFTFSRLMPYESWAATKAQAETLLTTYFGLITRYRLKRLAVRYINQLALPFDEHGKVDFDDYLTVGPQVPPGLGGGLKEFFTRTVIPFEEYLTDAIVTQSMESVDTEQGCVNVILDIDVFRNSDVNFAPNELWQFFDQLRDIKNSIFINSVTEKSKEMFR